MNWEHSLIRAFHDSKLGHVKHGFRIVTQIRSATSKFRQLSFLVEETAKDRKTIEQLLKEHPYQRLFSDNSFEREATLQIHQEIAAVYEHLVLWHEDFYIHSCIFLDIISDLLYWSLPHSLQNGVKHDSFGEFVKSVEDSPNKQLAFIRQNVSELTTIYRNTLKPLRDKVIVHHRASIMPVISYERIRVVIIDEFRPDRDKLIMQLRAQLKNKIDFSSYPQNDIDLVSQLVVEGHPIIAEQAPNLGIIGVELPDPDPIWIIIRQQCFSLLESLPILATLHSQQELT